MKHGMTVRANGDQVFDRVNAIVLANARNGNSVMDVNESHAKWSVSFAEVDAANLTDALVVADTDLASFNGAFVAVDEDLLRQPFDVLDVVRDLVRV